MPLVPDKSISKLIPLNLPKTIGLCSSILADPSLLMLTSILYFEIK